MKYFTLILSVLCFLYGIYAFFTSNLLKKDLEHIPKNRRHLYAKLCGVVLLFESAAMGILYYFQQKEPLKKVYYLIFLPFVLVAISFFIFRRVLTKSK